MAAAASPSTKAHAWKGRTKGGEWLFRFGIFVIRTFGPRGVWPFSYLIIGMFLLIGDRTLYGMATYWRRLRPRAGFALLWMLALRQGASFGRITCDRLLVYMHPDAYHIDTIGVQHLRELRSRNQGCILLSAHLGNWELSSFWLRNLAMGVGNVHVVMVRDDLEFVQQFVDQRIRGDFTKVIDPRDGLGASLAINAALTSGDMVCMLGDRVFGEQPSVMVDFLGRPVRLPLGPFQAAALTGVPIVVGFLVKTGMHAYRIEVDAPWYIRLPARRADRPAALRAAVQHWARRLELQVRRYPMQWHNFYDFWA